MNRSPLILALILAACQPPPAAPAEITEAPPPAPPADVVAEPPADTEEPVAEPVEEPAEEPGAEPLQPPAEEEEEPVFGDPETPFGMSDEELAGGTGEWMGPTTGDDEPPATEPTPEPTPEPAPEPAPRPEPVIGGEVDPEILDAPPDVPGMEELGSPPSSLDLPQMIALLEGQALDWAAPAVAAHYLDAKTIVGLKVDLALTDEQLEILQNIERNTLRTARTVGADILVAERAIDSWFTGGDKNSELLTGLLTDAAGKWALLRAVHLLSMAQSTSLLTTDQMAIVDRIMGWDGSGGIDSENA